jgi:hypothetical protein
MKQFLAITIAALILASCAGSQSGQTGGSLFCRNGTPADHPCFFRLSRRI